jgi:hypothetical protein
LDSSGFCNDELNLAIQAVSRETFDERFEELAKKVVAFVQKEGHCRIPQNYEEEASLGNWVKSEKKKGTLDKKKRSFLWQVKGRHDRKAGTK